jgi:hypothetical protein
MDCSISYGQKPKLIVSQQQRDVSCSFQKHSLFKRAVSLFYTVTKTSQKFLKVQAFRLQQANVSIEL